MIRLSQVKVPIRHTKETVMQAVAKQLRITPAEIASVQYKKRSIDARKKEEICYIYAVDVTLQNSKKETLKLPLSAMFNAEELQQVAN